MLLSSLDEVSDEDDDDAISDDPASVSWYDWWFGWWYIALDCGFCCSYEELWLYDCVSDWLDM